MRLSQHFGRTLRDAPADAHLASQRLIARAGLGRQPFPGAWSYLPIGWRVVQRLESLVRGAFDALGGQEIRLPVSGGGQSDSPSASFVEMMTALCKREIESYKDLPRLLYQVQTVTSRDPSLHGGLLRLRQWWEVDAFSLHAGMDDLDRCYSQVVHALAAVLGRCGLAISLIETAPDVGGGGASAQALVMLHSQGEISVARCPACGYAASIGVAEFARGRAGNGAPATLEKVATPDCQTIADLCAFLAIAPQQTLKAVLYTVRAGLPDEQTILVMLRGDLEVSEDKLKRLLGVQALEPASEEAIRTRVGAVPGYASPIGIAVQGEKCPEGALVIADESILTMSNFVTGANDPGYHMVNANYPRDFAVTTIADVALASDGMACARCGDTLRVESATMLVCCNRLGTFHAERTGATYLDPAGQPQSVAAGYYWLGLDQLMAAMVEAHHDGYGIVWPRPVAPFDVHLVRLAKDHAVAEVATKLYVDLQAAGLDVLYDDRDLSPGVMFADADLIGVPLRVTVSARSLESGGVEVKWRHEKDRQVIPLGQALSQIAALVQQS